MNKSIYIDIIKVNTLFISNNYNLGRLAMMSQEVNKNFWQKFLDQPRARREFLKLSGKSLVGVSVSSTLLGLLTGCEEIPEGVTGVVVPTGVLISDTSRCTGCRRCEVKCAITNDGKAQPHISRIKVGRIYNYGLDGTGNYVNGEIVPGTCQQCKVAACMEACPMDAIYADEKTGTRIVNEEKCIGCGSCERACPFGMIVVDPDVKKSKKCFLCNGDSQCAKWCPTASLKVVPWSEVHTVMINNKHLFM
jgi:Fe-S-cluster-containing dehydrogenase component